MNVDLANKKSKIDSSQDDKESDPGWGNRSEVLEKVAKRGEGRWCWRTGGEDSGEMSLGQLDKKVQSRFSPGRQKVQS